MTPDLAAAITGQRPNLPGCAHPIVRLRTEDGRAWWECRDCEVPFAPAVQPRTQEAGPSPLPQLVDGGAAVEYVAIRELARRIPYREGTIRNLMSQGRLKAGIHYVKPGGRVIFRWSAVQ